MSEAATEDREKLEPGPGSHSPPAEDKGEHNSRRNLMTGPKRRRRLGKHMLPALTGPCPTPSNMKPRLLLQEKGKPTTAAAEETVSRAAFATSAEVDRAPSAGMRMQSALAAPCLGPCGACLLLPAQVLDAASQPRVSLGYMAQGRLGAGRGMGRRLGGRVYSYSLLLLTRCG